MFALLILIRKRREVRGQILSSWNFDCELRTEKVWKIGNAWNRGGNRGQRISSQNS